MDSNPRLLGPVLPIRALGVAAAFLYGTAFILSIGRKDFGTPGADPLWATIFGALVLVGIVLALLPVLRRGPSRGLLLVAALSSAIVLGYSIGDYLTIKLCLNASVLIGLSICFGWPANLLSGFAAVAALTYFQHPTSLLGETMLVAKQPLIDPATELAFTVSLSVVVLASSLVKGLADRLRDAVATVSHLDITIDRLSEFNQDLQRYARVADEEAITKERHRISREIHDISGYIFTNIIALMDAAVSMGGRDPQSLAELHASARAQAREGLQETRRALRELRGSDTHRERGVGAIFKIKTVFERITGISVSVEPGNIPPTFGADIDMAVYRIVQESMTNAMRHGRATRVSVNFWITGGVLVLNVLDDGVGAKDIVKGIGLSGMEERIGRLGGTIKTGNAPEGGFHLQVTIPLSEGSEVIPTTQADPALVTQNRAEPWRTENDQY